MTERAQVPYSAPERETLTAFLNYHRDTLRMKCADLTPDQLEQRLEPSTMSLGGMLKHMAYVEDWWFGVNLAGRDPQPPFDDVDWEADEDWDWHSAAGATGDELQALLDEFIAESDAIMSEVATLEDETVRKHPRTGEGLSARWVLTHMIEEYARHNGHADLIRESIDGRTGQ